MEQPVKFNNTELPDIIELQGIKQVYDDKPPIIKDFNLLIEDKPNQGQFVVLLGGSGCGKCVAKGTWVTCETGLRRIEDLFDEQHPVDHLIPRSNLGVLVADENQKISHTYYGGKKKTIIITTEDGDRLEGTPEHPVLVNIADKEEWIPMANLQVGHSIAKEGLQTNFEHQENRVSLPRAIPKKFFAKQRKIRRYQKMGLNQREIAKLLDISPSAVNRDVRDQLKKPKFKAPGFMSSNMAYYLGLIAGDGSVGEQFGLTSADQELIDFFKTYTLKIFGVKVTQSKKKGTDAVLLRPKESHHFTRWMHKIFGGSCDANTKDVPKCIRQSSFKHQLNFLQGLFDTDGYSRLKNKDAEIALNSKGLIDFVCVMLSTMGIGYKRSFKGKSHRVYIRQSENVHKLFKLGRKQQLKSNRGALVRGYRVIASIETSENEVYDLTNPESHSFVAGGFVVHNSTILRYIAGLQEPTEGKVLIHGKERTASDRVGMVFQRYSSYPWLSVLDNVALGLEYQGTPRKERREKAMDMIRKVGLEGHEDKYAQYPTLSGGQLQRVAIARSLVYESQILLMDEPFGALDVETRLQMQDLLADIWTDIHPTVIFVTHDIPEAVYLGDDIYVMGKNPGNIRKMFVSPLPFERNKSMKRDLSFINKVNEIEDYMIDVGAK